MEVGLVLGAGGVAAEAWHAGVARALHDAAGWDARRAALIVGTSAGAVTGLALRAGLPPADLYAQQTGEACSREGQDILDRVVTEYSEGVSGRAQRGWASEWAPQSPKLTARALWPPWQLRPVHAAVGLLPSGARTTDALEQRLAEMHPEAWPRRRFWVTAVRLDDGRRVVFGRDDVETTAARAVRASCAIPVRYEPVTVAGRQHVDGGIHSATNADLAGPPAFDAVVVSSVMSGDAGWSKVAGGLRQAWWRARDGLGSFGRHFSAGDQPRSPDGQPPPPDGQPPPTDDQPPPTDSAWWREAWSQAWADGRAVRAGRRQWMADRLRDEVDGLRRRGAAVLVVEPDSAAVELLDSCRADAEGGDGVRRSRRESRAEIAALAREATLRQLRGNAGARAASLLRRASASAARGRA